MKRKNKFESLKEKVREEKKQLRPTGAINPNRDNVIFFNHIQKQLFGKETYDKKKKNTHR